MPHMSITLATVFTMLRIASEAEMRQVTCGGECPAWACSHGDLLRDGAVLPEALEDSVYPVMTEDQFALKLFPVYRYFVTVWLRNNTPEVLTQILEMAFITNSPVPKMQLHIIFTELHVQVCSRAPAQQRFSSENLAEILHRFIALARSYPKELMQFFLSQMEMSKEAVRVGTLALIGTVVSADEPRMSIRTISLAIRVVKNTLSDTRSKVRMAILRIIG
ncbi:unnamed protein product [Rangifer tarandus platyrhynchus]|uniref:Uncharacterized protein n=1 Tax=Rangifer tarandus platyrhynchus TaxID=3082113 RepID=A0ACB1KE49_RANTA